MEKSSRLRAKAGDNDDSDKTVWLLEDSTLEAGVVQRVLSNDFRVEVFTDGSTLIESLARRGEPLALILDWQLPGMSGIEVCRFVRASHDMLSLPVLMLTVYGSKADLVAGLDAGANDYVTKPYDPQELRRRVLNLVAASQAFHRAKQLEISQAESLRREQAARAQLEVLIGIVSHDLRNPIAAINLASETLRRADLSERSLAIAQRIQGAASRANRLIYDLLDFAQARMGGLSISVRSTDFESVICAVLDEERVSHPDRTIDYRGGGELVGSWDPDRLTQIITNLVENALKYSPVDTPVIVSVSGDEENISLVVHNEGAPIASNLLPSIFEPMRRATARTGYMGRSVGLGLYIVRQIVECHGGRISVSSSAAKGTTFTVQLPRTCKSSDEPCETDAPSEMPAAHPS